MQLLGCECPDGLEEERRFSYHRDLGDELLRCEGYNGDHCDSPMNQFFVLHQHLAFRILWVQTHRVKAVVT